MYGAFFKIVAKPGKRGELVEFLKWDGAVARAAEPGTKRFDVWDVPGEPDALYVYEAYTDSAAFNHHKANEPYQRFVSYIEPQLLDPQRRVNIFDFMDSVTSNEDLVWEIASFKQPHQLDKDLFKAYEDGKHRRYSLMFAVNGGAFAVARLLGEQGDAATGDLTLRHLAVGMIVFTTVMSFDILTFGLKMREQWKSSVPDLQKPSIWDGLFSLPGWIVLTTIWLLISFGWLLVSTGRSV